MTRVQSALVAIVVAVMLCLPVLFLFAMPGAPAPGWPLSEIYDSALLLFGERWVRAVWCALWLGLEVALLFSIIRLRRRGVDPGPPIDYLGD